MIRIRSLHDLAEEDVLREVIAQGEGPTLEFKSSTPPASVLAKLMSSFANADGGLILIGIGGDGKTTGSRLR